MRPHPSARIVLQIADGTVHPAHAPTGAQLLPAGCRARIPAPTTESQVGLTLRAAGRRHGLPSSRHSHRQERQIGSDTTQNPLLVSRSQHAPPRSSRPGPSEALKPDIRSVRAPGQKHQRTSPNLRWTLAGSCSNGTAVCSLPADRARRRSRRCQKRGFAARPPASFPQHGGRKGSR